MQDSRAERRTGQDHQTPDCAEADPLFRELGAPKEVAVIGFKLNGVSGVPGVSGVVGVFGEIGCTIFGVHR